MKKHGLSKTRAWKSWHNMRQRVMCASNKNYSKYKQYPIEPSWGVFLNFYADMGDCPSGMTLDRRDNAKGYTKGNCRWATITQQNRNNCANKLSEVKVIALKKEINILSGYALAKKYGVSRPTICDLRYGRTWGEVGNV